MEYNLKALLTALQRCLPGVDTGKTVLEGADTFVFREGKIFTYNDSISVSVPFDSDLSGAVKAKEFYNLLSKFSAESVKIVAISETVWKVKAGSAVAEFTLLDSTTLDSVVKALTVDTWKKLPKNFLDGLSLCKFSCNRSSLAGIFVKDSSMLSTDEMRINRFELDKKMESFWINDSAASELMKLTDLTEYSLTDAWAHFRSEAGTVFSCKRLHDEKFPAVKLLSVIKDHEQSKEDITNELPAKLVDAIERASALAMDVDSYSAVRLTFSPQCLEIYSQRTSGKYSEKIPWDKKFASDFEPVVVYVDSAMVAYGLKRSRAFYIKTVRQKRGEMTRLIFTGAGIVHIVTTLAKAD